MALRRDKSRTIRRVARVTRKSKSKPSKQQPFALLDRVQELSDVDAKVKEQIAESRREAKKEKGSE